MQSIVKQEVTTEIILEKRKPRKDNKYPVKLRVTFKREQRYYSLRYSVKNKRPEEITDYERYWAKSAEKGISMTVEEFKKARTANSKEPYKTMFIYLNELEAIARDIKVALHPFTFLAFQKKYFQQPGCDLNIIDKLLDYSKEIRLKGRISSADLFDFTAISLQKFTGSDNLPFNEVTVDFLHSYENWMKEHGKSTTTIGMYLRNVRTVYNQIKREAKQYDEKGLIPSLYPFGKDAFKIPTGRNIKKSLTLHEIQLILGYKASEGAPELRSRDYWLFSYFCNGINFKDIAKLKYRDLDGDIIKLVRSKTTEENREDPQIITIIVTTEVSEIIKKWGNKPGDPDQFIFPIIDKTMSPDRQHKVILQTIRLINDHLDKIAKAVGLKQKVTTYVARHSHATILKRAGASTEFISETLGHASISTTRKYLADFEIESKREWAKRISGIKPVIKEQ